jgi:hypothetical protein
MSPAPFCLFFLCLSIAEALRLSASPNCDKACKDLQELILKERGASNWNVYYQEIADFLTQEKSVEVAEIGTAWGGLAAHLVAHVPNITMNAIDPFLAGYDKDDIQSTTYGNMMRQYGLTNEGFSKTFADAMESNLNPIADASHATYRLHHKKSLDAAPDFSDASLDAVFVDGLHTYEGVVDDIKAYTPKIKKGGLLMFNDYGAGNFPGVTKAIQEFAGKEKKEISVIGQQSHGNVYIRL